jgi:disulfide bond formation protein DsbB
MQEPDVNDTVERFGAHSLWIGIVLLVAGTLGVLLPVALSIMTIAVIASVMVAGGLLWVWPQFSLSLVGLFVSISLIFDDWALVMIGRSLNRSESARETM